MNERLKRISRQAVALAIAGGTTACSISTPYFEIRVGRGETPTPTHAPVRIPESRPTATLRPAPPMPEPKPFPTASPTRSPVIPRPTIPLPAREATPFPSHEQQQDEMIKRRIEQAKKGEKLLLQDPLIKYIIKLPWIGDERLLGEAYVATLHTISESQKEDIVAILTSSDCIFDRFQQTSQIQRAVIPGVWRPNARVDVLRTEVKVSSTVATPLAFLNSEELTHRGVTRTCKEESAVDRLTELLRKVDWKGIPRETGEFVGWFAREFTEGVLKELRRTPTR